MESFYGSDGLIIRYARDLAFASIEDELEIEILSQDVCEFLDHVRRADLNEILSPVGSFQGRYGTSFRFDSKLFCVMIEDDEGRRIMTTSFHEFAGAMRELGLKRALEESGLVGVL